MTDSQTSKEQTYLEWRWHNKDDPQPWSLVLVTPSRDWAILNSPNRLEVRGVPDEPSGFEQCRDIVAALVRELRGDARHGAMLALDAIAKAMIGTRASPPPLAVGNRVTYGGNDFRIVGTETHYRLAADDYPDGAYIVIGADRLAPTKPGSTTVVESVNIVGSTGEAGASASSGSQSHGRPDQALAGSSPAGGTTHETSGEQS